MNKKLNYSDVKHLSWEEQLFQVTKHLPHPEKLIRYVCGEKQTRSEFEALGGTEDIYSSIKSVIDDYCLRTFKDISRLQDQYRKSFFNTCYEENKAIIDQAAQETNVHLEQT